MTSIPIDEDRLRELAALCQDYQIPALFLPNQLKGQPKNDLERHYMALVKDAEDLLRILDDAEIVQIARDMGSWITRTIEAPLLARNRELRDVALFYVSWRVRAITTDIREVISAKPGQGRVFEIYPELVELLDADGLLRLDARFHLSDWGILYKEHLLHFHYLLGRGYSGKPNMDFTGAFARYANSSHQLSPCRIAIDADRMMPREALRKYMEFDTWYGPPFDSSRLDSPSHVGLTVVGRNKRSLFHLGAKLEFTDFLWSYKKGVKTFELEEASSIDYQFSGLILNRYVHSERDTTQNKFRHLDGAVKIFDPETYATRLDRHLPDTKFAKKKTKLWRIDGDIPEDVWMDLIAMFMKENEMVFEYFDPEGFKTRFPLRVRDPDAWKQLSGEEQQRLADWG